MKNIERYKYFDTKVGFTNIKKFVDDLTDLMVYFPGTTDVGVAIIQQSIAQGFKIVFKEKNFYKGPQGNVMLHLPFEVTADLLDTLEMEKYKSGNTNANAYLEYIISPDVPGNIVLVAHMTDELLDAIFLYSTENFTSATQYMGGKDIYDSDESKRSQAFTVHSMDCLMTFVTTAAIFSNKVYTEEYLVEVFTFNNDINKPFEPKKQIMEKIQGDPFIESITSHPLFNLSGSPELGNHAVMGALQLKLVLYEQNPELFRLKEENK
jgi:hypothetical protein